MPAKIEQSIIYTLGYEGRTAEEVLVRLKKEGVSLLLDVRYRPMSRKPGLSKNKLKEACAHLGIDYLHDRNLGTPPDLMKAHRELKGYNEELFKKMAVYISAQRSSLDAASSLALSRPTCLLCYEADPNQCHRKIVAEQIAALSGQDIEHLK